jgi:hypothetical protein
MRLLIVLVAFGLADGQGHRQVEPTQEGFEVGGVLAGSVDADVEVGLRVLLLQALQAFVQGLVAGAVFQDGEGLGSGLAVRAQEGNAVTVACGVDADADTVEDLCGGHGGTPQQVSKGRPEGQQPGGACARECCAVSLLRCIFGQAILVISGLSRRRYRYLVPKSEGTILIKRSKPQAI